MDHVGADVAGAQAVFAPVGGGGVEVCGCGGRGEGCGGGVGGEVRGWLGR